MHLPHSRFPGVIHCFILWGRLGCGPLALLADGAKLRAL
jgi:hypothetical protein